MAWVLHERSGLFWGPVSLEFKEDGLKMFKMRGPVLDFFHLVLRISSNPTPATVHKGPGVSEIFLEEGLEFWPS